LADAIASSSSGEEFLSGESGIPSWVEMTPRIVPKRSSSSSSSEQGSEDLDPITSRKKNSIKTLTEITDFQFKLANQLMLFDSNLTLLALDLLQYGLNRDSLFRIARRFGMKKLAVKVLQPKTAREAEYCLETVLAVGEEEEKNKLERVEEILELCQHLYPFLLHPTNTALADVHRSGSASALVGGDKTETNVEQLHQNQNDIDEDFIKYGAPDR
ncbi:unnamed protein product, partial [Amoebophrya sp. A120]